MELAYRAYDAINQRDLDGLLALVDEEVEAVSRLVAIEGGYHGHAGMRRWWSNVLEVIPDYAIEVLEVRDLGDLTLAALRPSGHGAGSGTPIDELQWQLVEWRHRKVVWWSVYPTEAEALEAAGVRE